MIIVVVDGRPEVPKTKKYSTMVPFRRGRTAAGSSFSGIGLRSRRRLAGFQPFALGEGPLKPPRGQERPGATLAGTTLVRIIQVPAGGNGQPRQNCLTTSGSGCLH